MLAFTNSVQDAAHQACFVERRNYRFSLRASIQKVVNEVMGPIRLSELSQAFMDYWKEHADPTGDDQLAVICTDSFRKITWVKLLGKLPSAQRWLCTLLKEFDLRVQWEIYSEFGFNSRIGRTLEKTGASAVYFDKDTLHKSWENIANWLNVNDVSQSIKKDDYLRFTTLILHRSRNRGAVNHEFLNKFREEELKLWDLNWQKDSRHFLNPKYGPRDRLPNF